MCDGDGEKKKKMNLEGGGVMFERDENVSPVMQVVF